MKFSMREVKKVQQEQRWRRMNWYQRLLYCLCQKLGVKVD